MIDVTPCCAVYIEDNIANMRLMEKLLSRHPSVKLFTASNAEEGMDVLRDVKPDVVLMDINLPGKSGLDAFDEIKADDDLKHIPVVAISADAIPDNIQRALDKGFNAYLTKPYQVNDVLMAINKALDVK